MPPVSQRRGTSRSGAPASKIGRMLQDYHQAINTVDFNAVAAGAEKAVLIVDNSAKYSNSVLKFSKLTIRVVYDAVDVESGVFTSRTLYMAVIKQDEDDSSILELDSEEAVREARNKGRILRGPWMVTTPGLTTSGFIPPMIGHMKAIVLKNFVLDREEDLWVVFTVADASFAATSQVMRFFMRGFVRVIK